MYSELIILSRFDLSSLFELLVLDHEVNERPEDQHQGAGDDVQDPVQLNRRRLHAVLYLNYHVSVVISSLVMEGVVSIPLALVGIDASLVALVDDGLALCILVRDGYVGAPLRGASAVGV